MWRGRFNTLLKRQAPSSSAPELGHVQRPTYAAVSEEPASESEVLVRIQKMKNKKSGGMIELAQKCGDLSISPVQYRLTEGYLARGNSLSQFLSTLSQPSRNPGIPVE
ncbi:hypothetical protein RB195_011282 [Necator americanus]|uniref:Uncharacterized protein n=1 Tax=Necator americanus TaxID=51031 RepID=A0ABR1D4Y7_NECAM